MLYDRDLSFLWYFSIYIRINFNMIYLKNIYIKINFNIIGLKNVFTCDKKKNVPVSLNSMDVPNIRVNATTVNGKY